MTIPYQDNFLRVLLRWKGSVWKAVWKEFLIWLCLFYAVRLALYFTLIEEEQRSKAKKIIQLFETFTRKVPLEFLLGFYVVQVVTRWWQQVLDVPWPDDALVWTNALFPGDDQKSKQRRHTVARYIILCEILALREISTRIRKRFPKIANLVEAGLMLENEKQLYDECPSEELRWQLPLSWAISIVLPATGTDPGKIPLVVMGQLINPLNKIREDLRKLLLYDWICIPLVYTQTVSVVVYAYFFGLCLIGHQYLGKEPDIYAPVLTILQFVFYVGWLKVAQDLMRPFGEDDDDVELNVILDRHVSVAFTMVDHVCNNNPPLVEDPLFRNANKTGPDGKLIINCPQLPYSVISMRSSRDHPPKLHAVVNIVSDDQAEMIYEPPPWVKNRKKLERSATVGACSTSKETNDGSNGGRLRRSKTLGVWLKKSTASIAKRKGKRGKRDGKKNGEQGGQENVHF